MRRLVTMLTMLALTTGILVAGDIVWGEDFENLTGSSPYNPPAGWMNYSPIISGVGVQFLDNVGVGGSVGLRYHASGQVNMHGLFLYTPVVQNIPADATFKMDYRIMQPGSLVNPGNFNGAIEVYACDPIEPDYYYNIMIYLTGIEPSSEWRTISLPLTNYVNQSKIFWIYTYNEVSDNYDIYLDNIRVEIPFNSDLLAENMTGLQTITQGYLSNYRFSVTNIGYQAVAASDYEVTLFLVGDNNNAELIAETQPGVALARGEFATFTFSWQPATAGDFQLYGQVTYTADEDNSNNATALYDVSAGTDIIFDLAVTLEGNAEQGQGVESTYLIIVKNVGVIQANDGDYSVRLKNNGITIGTQAGRAIAPEDTLTFIFSWIPDAIGRFQIYTVVDYEVDVNPEDNTTEPIEVVVLPANLSTVDLFLTPTTTGILYPVNYNYCNSLSQTIFTKEELGGWANQGKIWKLVMRFQRNERAYAVPNDIPVQIYLANAPSTLASFASTADYYDYTHFVKVYDAPLDLGEVNSINDIFIYLGTGEGTEDFIYEGENLVLMMYKEESSSYWGNNWHLNTGTVGINRTLYQYADAPIIDIQHPAPPIQWNNGMSASFPMTKFLIQGVDYGTTLTVNVTDTATNAPIENAKIYVAESPNIFTQTNSGGASVLSNISMEWGIVVSAMGYTTQRFTPAQIGWNEATKTATLNVGLIGRPTDLSIAGYVKLPDTGIGVNGVAVALRGYLSNNTVTTNDNEGNPGYYTFQGLYGLSDYTLTATLSTTPLVINNTEYTNPDPKAVYLGEASTHDAHIHLIETMIYPINVRATANEQDSEVLVTWFNPLWEYTSFSHANLGWNSAFGVYAAATFTVAHRYNAAQLAEKGVAGWDLYKVGFVPNEADAIYTLKIWVTDKAELTDPGTLTPVAIVPIPAVSVGKLNEIFLSNYVAIPEAAQIFVGYEVASKGGSPVAYSYRPENNGFSNLLCVDGGWTTLQAQYYYGSWSIYLTAIAPDTNPANATPVRYSQVTKPTQHPVRPIQLISAQVVGSENVSGNFRLGHTPSRVTRGFNGSFEVYRMLATEEAGNAPLAVVTGLPTTQRDLHYLDSTWGAAETQQTYKYAIKTVHEGSEYHNNYPTSGPVYSNNILKALVGSLAVKVTMQDYDVTGATISLTHESMLVPNLIYTLQPADNGSHTFSQIYLAMPYEVTVTLAGGTTYSNTHAFSYPNNTLNISLLPKTTLLSQAFNAGQPAGWVNIDANNDGYSWGFDNTNFTGPEGAGTTAAYSESFNFGIGTIKPDNWLVSPLIFLPEGVKAGLEFYIAAKAQNYPSDRVLIYIAPADGVGNPGWQTFIENRDTIGDSYGNPASEVIVAGATMLDDHRVKAYPTNNGFYKLDYDISAYEGQTVRIAIRHAFCQDNEAVKIANFLAYAIEFEPIQVSGIVVDVDGNPVGDAKVTLSSALPISAITNYEGAFTLANVPSGMKYTVTATKTGYHSASVNIITGNADFVIAEPIVIDTKLSDSDVTKPNVTALKANYPNPFNPSTTIAFDIAKNGHVAIDVYNILGQRVKKLADRVFEAGTHQVEWNGTDDNGKSVGSGVYFYRMTTKEYSGMHKMLLMK